MTPTLSALTLALTLAAGQATKAPAPAAAARCEGEPEAPVRVLELDRQGGKIALLAARAAIDPADPLVALERRLEAFAPTVVLVEDGAVAGVPLPPQRGLAIAQGGEQGLACWVAARRGVPCRGVDLPEQEEARHLLKTHPADEVLLFLVVRSLAYFNPKPVDQRPPGDGVLWALRRYGRMVNLPYANPLNLSNTWQRVLSRPYEPAAAVPEWHDPRKDELLTQKMAREAEALREPWTVGKIAAAATGGAKVFAAVSETHVCRIRDALRPAAAAPPAP